MKAKSYLERIELMDTRINTRLQELGMLYALATKTSAVLGGDRVQSFGSQQKMADSVSKIVDTKKTINAEIDGFVNYKQEALQTMDEYCDSDSIKLLYARYFQYKTWEQIAVELNYTYKWVSGGLHQRALMQIQKGLDERKGA